LLIVILIKSTYQLQLLYHWMNPYNFTTLNKCIIKLCDSYFILIFAIADFKPGDEGETHSASIVLIRSIFGSNGEYKI